MSRGNKVRTITCKGCQETVTKRLRPGQEYCTLECYRSSAHPDRQTGERHACAWCGADVYVPQHRLGEERYFCNPDHASQYRGRNQITLTCKVCTTQFKRSPSWLNHNAGIYCSLPCRDADPDFQAQLIEMNVMQQRGKQTRLERDGYALLDSLLIPYLPQYLIADKFCVDAFVPGALTVIQFDGDYWHGNPDIYAQLDTRQARRVTLDKSQDAYMRACGYSIIRIYEAELRRRRLSLIDRLTAHFSTRLHLLQSEERLTLTDACLSNLELHTPLLNPCEVKA
jgi:very-short-patch-repair endonuclease